eukprot:m.49639 g.49639  ORF g.49639 m.49639 type:complete len:412 (+) comp7462_c0_seq5:228-1463(+)
MERSSSSSSNTTTFHEGSEAAFPEDVKHRMVAFASKKGMDMHNPPSMLRGVSELKERGDLILKILEENKEELCLDIFEPDDDGISCILNVHNESLFKFVEVAFARYKKQLGDDDDVEYLQNDSFAVGYMYSEQARLHAIEVLEDETLNIMYAAGLFLGDSVTIITEGTFHAAYQAAQCAISAMKSLFFPKKKLRRKLSSLKAATPNFEKIGEDPPITSYALCRPPGHHASASVAGGYCFFNNVAIAAQFAVDNGYRVSILDVDFHHGNGTQKIFYKRKDVLFVSMHCDPKLMFPFWSGYEEEIGEGEGEGFNMNISLPIGTNGGEFMNELRTRALPRLAEKRMDILLISFGGDTARDDPEGGFLLDTPDFEEMGYAIRTAFPTKRICVIQEGGYGLEVLDKNVKAFLKGLL